MPPSAFGFDFPVAASLARSAIRLACAYLLLAGAATASADDRPNFLVILADDATWSDFGFTGSPDAKTPHLDRLATQSLRFTRMYSPASCCSPTRHALYTGLGPIRSGAYPNHTRVEQGTRSLFTHLKEVGYRVALQGKEHVAPRASFPYERLGNVPDGAPAKTRAFLSSAKEQDEPWLLVYASHEPHVPWNRGDASRWNADDVTVPPTMLDTPETRESLVQYHAEISALDGEVGDLLKALDETGAAENTVVIFLSEQGGQMPGAGKWTCWETGVRAAALVRWPGRVAAGATTDALASYIDVTPTLLEIAGLDPAAVDPGCPDAEGNVPMDGRSLLPVLTGDATEHREFVFAEHTNVGINGATAPFPIRSAVGRRFKYIRNLAPGNEFSIGGTQKSAAFQSWKALASDGDQRAKALVQRIERRPAEEFYDLDSDPYELVNLAQFVSPAHRQDAERMELSAALDAWMAQQGDEGMETERNARAHQNRGGGKRPKAKSVPGRN
ncbi:sulfatase family protein [Alienimonas chondri]|uniref:Sulfatase N-terminal domain-containing protein n=1 Tax=Alienimonas chondri TaxID=2681879 RepID=A0ABX1VHX4_9PLAN|nr:sulfatase [Alienimonas chondri]NNJ27110.1 hypothetical protein [Alienimonas chondri]